MLRAASAAFAGGVVGALANSAAVLLAANTHLVPAPPGGPPWLYQRLVWGGIFGLVLLAPLLRGRTLERGLLASLVPSAARLTLFAPPGGHADLRTVAAVLVLNAV